MKYENILLETEENTLDVVEDASTEDTSLPLFETSEEVAATFDEEPVVFSTNNEEEVKKEEIEEDTPSIVTEYYDEEPDIIKVDEMDSLNPNKATRASKLPARKLFEDETSCKCSSKKGSLIRFINLKTLVHVDDKYIADWKIYKVSEEEEIEQMKHDKRYSTFE